MESGTTGKPVANLDANNPRDKRGRTIPVSKPGAFAVFLAVLAVILAACGGGSGDSVETLPSISSGSEVQMDKDRAPNFAVTLFQGEDVLGASQLNIHDLPVGKPLVLNFWAGLCPPCRAEMPDLQKFNDEFGDRLTLLGVDLGQFIGLGTQEDAKNLLDELQVTYPTGFTDDANVIRDYRVLGLPATIFIDSKGQIFKNWGGALNLEVLREQSNAMLAQ